MIEGETERNRLKRDEE